MKKTKTLLLCSLILFSLIASAQERRFIRMPENIANRQDLIECPPDNCIFSQLPEYDVALDFGAPSPYRIAEDFTTVSAPVSVRLWGLYFDISTDEDCQPPEMTFIVAFYERNTVNPSIPGDEVVSYTITVAPQYPPIYFYDWYQLFQADIGFPEPAPITDGWVSVMFVNEAFPCFPFWIGSSLEPGTGPLMACVSYDGIEWYTSMEEFDFECAMDFCLTGAPPVPLSGWAIGLGVFLILAAVLLRFRRVI